MPALLQAVILGIIQGLTEFLPVSSSAHLVILPEIFNWHYLGKAFDVAAHIGTFLALLIYFRKEVLAILKSFAGALKHKDTPNLKLGGMLIVSTLPAVLFGLLINDRIESHFHHLNLIGALLIIFGIFLFSADRWGKKQKELSDFSWADALLIGISQALALLPGVSRCGVTITYGLLAGFKREAAARYSFLISLPVIAGAGLFEGVSLLVKPQEFSLPPALLVLLFSFISGFFCIKYFLNYLQKHNFDPFVIYRILLGIFILGVWLFK